MGPLVCERVSLVRVFAYFVCACSVHERACCCACLCMCVKCVGVRGCLCWFLRLLAEHAMSTVDALLDLFDRLLN